MRVRLTSSYMIITRSVQMCFVYTNQKYYQVLNKYAAAPTSIWHIDSNPSLHMNECMQYHLTSRQNFGLPFMSSPLHHPVTKQFTEKTTHSLMKDTDTDRNSGLLSALIGLKLCVL